VSQSNSGQAGRCKPVNSQSRAIRNAEKDPAKTMIDDATGDGNMHRVRPILCVQFWGETTLSTFTLGCAIPR
jgi:hypothetical protein